MKKLTFIIFFFTFSLSFTQCISGNCEIGSGTYKYDNGSIYKGEWWNNEMNGEGTLIWPDGSVYVGEFKNGLYHGNGTYLDFKNSKSLYIGEFIDETENGNGTMIFENEDIYIGQLKEGKMNGFGTLFKKDGSIKEGYWENNIPINQM